jgi:exonuclease VII small subunit
MLTPAKIQAISDPIEEVYIHIVDELMVNIGKHLTSPTWTHTAAWEIQKLSEMGQLTHENAEIINKWIKQLPKEVRDAMEETRRLALEKIEKDMEKAVRLGKLPEPLADSTVNVLNEYSQQAIDQLNLVNTVMLQSSVQQYQRAVQLTKEEYDKLMQQQEQTQIILNEAAGSVATGIETREKALRRAITRISDEGLTGFIDRAGHHWSPEAYVNMDIRTTVHNTAIQSVKNFMTDYNTQVFQVSSHAAARPGCYPYQGKFYSWDNSAGEIELGNGSTVRYEPLNVTTYGQPAGLFGINCGHYPIPIVPGVTIPHGADNIQPKEENDKAYEESQVQRSLERQIREAKRVVEMAGDKASPEMKQKVKDAQEQMRDFIARTGRTRRYDREKIGGLPKGSGTQTMQSEPSTNKASGISNIKDATTVKEVENAMKSQGWFWITEVNGQEFNGNEKVNISDADLTMAKSIFESHKQVFEKYPQLVGQFNAPTIGTPISSRRAYAETFAGNSGRGGITFARKWFSNAERLQKDYEGGVKAKWSPAGCTSESIAVHEIGHEIDLWLSFVKGKYTTSPKGKVQYFSTTFRDAVYKGSGLKRSNMKEDLSEYATKNAAEFFAEAFAEYMTSPNPRPLAMRFGKMLDEVMKEYE